MVSVECHDISLTHIMHLNISLRKEFHFHLSGCWHRWVSTAVPLIRGGLRSWRRPVRIPTLVCFSVMQMSPASRVGGESTARKDAIFFLLFLKFLDTTFFFLLLIGLGRLEEMASASVYPEAVYCVFSYRCFRRRG